MVKHFVQTLSLMIFIFSLSVASYGNSGAEVAKAILLKGEVSESYFDRNGKKQTRLLTKGSNVHEGAEVTCSSSGFVKLLFFDKSQMMISPNSTVEIKSFTKNDAGMINLIKGRIRSKVTKDRMNINNEKSSKLFIKTKTAAMGVRGTDFQVIYNPANTVTSLLTFEGAVAMAKLDSREDSNKLSNRALEARLNSSQAVMVRRGQFSGAMPGHNRVSLPVKISPVQLEKLRGTDEVSQGQIPPTKKPNSKVVRSVVPPGLDAKMVATQKDKIIESVAQKKMGLNKTDFKKERIKNAYYEKVESDIPPEGIVSKSGDDAYAPAAGGYLDNQTGLYIAPGKGDAYDSNAGVYVPSPEVGSIDPRSGDYIPPEGTKLADSGELIKVRGTRGPASVNGPKEIAVKNVMKNNFYDGGNARVISDSNIAAEGQVKTAIDFNDYKTETVVNYNDNTDILIKKTREVQRRKVKINIRR